MRAPSNSGARPFGNPPKPRIFRNWTCRMSNGTGRCYGLNGVFNPSAKQYLPRVVRGSMGTAHTPMRTATAPMTQIPQLADDRVLNSAETALALKLISRMDFLRLKTIARWHARGLPPHVT